MSFAEQERALFDLLFDQPLRERFLAHSTAALADYQLTSAELADFHRIRPEGLMVDVDLRVDQILTHFCRQFPLSFSLISSLPTGMNQLRRLVNRQTMLQPPEDRATQFGLQLQEQLAALASKCDPAFQVMLGASVATELGLTWTSATLKKQLLTNPASVEHPPIPGNAVIDNDWIDRPVKLAAQVTAALLPQPYSRMKKQFCPAAGIQLWAHLSNNPVAHAKIKAALTTEQPSLFISRAYAPKTTSCESQIDQITLELNDGFAPLLQQIDGNHSVNQILDNLVDVGASDSIVASVQAGFKQLLESSIIEVT